MEDKLSKPENISLLFEIKSTGLINSRLNGECLFLEKDNVELTLKGSFINKSIFVSLQSVGAKLQNYSKENFNNKPTPTKLTELILTGIIRTGLLFSFARLLENQLPEKTNNIVSDLLMIFKERIPKLENSNDNYFQSNSFDISAEEKSGKAIIEIDKETNLPIRKSFTINSLDESIEIVENYKWRLNK